MCVCVFVSCVDQVTSKKCQTDVRCDLKEGVEGWNEIERVADIFIRDATLKISTIGIKIKEKTQIYFFKRHIDAEHLYNRSL